MIILAPIFWDGVDKDWSFCVIVWNLIVQNLSRCTCTVYVHVLKRLYTLVPALQDKSISFLLFVFYIKGKCFILIIVFYLCFTLFARALNRYYCWLFRLDVDANKTSSERQSSGLKWKEITRWYIDKSQPIRVILCIETRGAVIELLVYVRKYCIWACIQCAITCVQRKKVEIQ